MRIASRAHLYAAESSPNLPLVKLWHAFVALESQLLAARRGEHAARDRIAEHEAIFRWLLGEEGEFPESLPGKRYNFRTELRQRLAALAATPEEKCTK